MRMGACRIAVLLLIAARALRASGPSADSEDWADSPEAYFLTAEERAEWVKLDSRDSRAGFKDRYWLKRDPSPGTDRNEFRETVLARIKVADERFGIEKRPGSRTARGLVFVVFGSPARVRDEHARPPTGGRVGDLGGSAEGNETITHWIYDRDRTPRILEAIELPSLEVEIIIDPNRHSDAIQSPGLVKELRERLAHKSIVNPDLIPPDSGAVGAPAAARLPRAALDAAVRSVLEQAPFSSRNGETVFGSAVLWRDTGGPETIVWFYLPPAAGGAARFLHGVVKKEAGGEEVATLSEPVALSDALSAGNPGEIILRRLTLPPGAYDAAFAITETSGGQSRPVASAAEKLSVPNLDAGFAISPLLLTRGPGTRSPGDDTSPFAVGPAVVPPRADAQFSTSESLWFFLELANPPDSSKVTFEVRLRKGAEQISSRPAFPAQPAAIAAGRYLCGFELPLSGFASGDYRLYIVVRDGIAPPDQYVVRSADFRIRP